MQQSVIALVIVAVMIVLMLIQRHPIAVIAMVGAFAMAAFKLISMNDIIGQFGKSSVFCVLGMMVIGGAIFDTGLAQMLSKKLLASGAKSEKAFMTMLLIVVFVFSACLSNTATTAIFIPVVTAVIASEKRIESKKIIMLIGYAAGLGGCATMIGSPSQHQLGNSILEANGFEAMPFFYGLRGSLVLLLIMVLYFLTIGGKIQDKILVYTDAVDEPTDPVPEKNHPQKQIFKMTMSGIILVICVILIALEIVSSGAGALLGAIACVVAGCFDVQTAFKKINWEVIMLLGALFAVANGFNSSGAGELCTNAIFILIGGNYPFLVYSLIVAVSIILTSFIDNIACQALIAPIAISLAIKLGLNPSTVIFSVLAGCNIAYLTPISTPCISMTLCGGYRFSDYVKIGGPLSLLSCLTIIIIFPILYGL